MKVYPQQFLMTLKKLLRGEEAESFIKGRLEKNEDKTDIYDDNPVNPLQAGVNIATINGCRPLLQVTFLRKHSNCKSGKQSSLV